METSFFVLAENIDFYCFRSSLKPTSFNNFVRMHLWVHAKFDKHVTDVGFQFLSDFFFMDTVFPRNVFGSWKNKDNQFEQIAEASGALRCSQETKMSTGGTYSTSLASRKPRLTGHGGQQVYGQHFFWDFSHFRICFPQKVIRREGDSKSDFTQSRGGWTPRGRWT